VTSATSTRTPGGRERRRRGGRGAARVSVRDAGVRARRSTASRLQDHRVSLRGARVPFHRERSVRYAGVWVQGLHDGGIRDELRTAKPDTRPQGCRSARDVPASAHCRHWRWAMEPPGAGHCGPPCVGAGFTPPSRTLVHSPPRRCNAAAMRPQGARHSGTPYVHAPKRIIVVCRQAATRPEVSRLHADPTIERLLDELVAAVDERECGDPDGRDWLVETRIRGIERTLLETYRLRPRPPIEVRLDPRLEGLPAPRTLDLVGISSRR
jgi:hypothetical protein